MDASFPFIHTPFPPQLFTQSSHSKPNLQFNVNVVRHLHSSIVSTAENCFTFLDTFASPNPLLDKIFHFFSSHFHNFSQCALGFGLDSTNNDYKVVRIVYLYDSIVEIDIYSLKEGCWRNLSVSGPVLPLCCDSSQVSLNGTIHWLSGGGNFPGPFIVTFNLGTQVFSLMELPRSLVYKKAPRRLSIAVFQDSLFVFENDYYGKVSIWMMKQYGAVESWTNLFGLDFDREGSVKVIGWKRNGEVLLTKDEEMVSVDIKTQEFKNVGMRGYDEPFCVNVYTESLVLIDKVHGGFGEQARSSLLQAPRTELEEPRKL
ncbi:F-box/kelch-repeat protein At3g06240-like [Cornus florida]|uniref:F-box/kelch-repeat protein At3g06240-like n=1 Tax=Cornus florida TaxID=4283 RepID=UPI0028A141EC|nr:F-box/kelch-repeat protein At3g06240-like [Cornus florida]